MISRYYSLSIRLFRLYCIFLLALAFQIHAEASQTENTNKKIALNPFSLLAGIDEANHSSSFTGLLTYEANGYINTMRLTQTVIDNTVSQRLHFLDGPKRQVFRQTTFPDCGESVPKWQLWPQNLELDKLSRVYNITANGVERVADREAYIINVTPYDNHRYGYRFSIDSETGLLLKTLFIIDKKVIERLQFVELLLHKNDGKGDHNDPPYTVAAEVDEQQFTVSANQPCNSDESRGDWNATWLPEGFVPVGSRLTDHNEQALVFSDGLATLSIFIVDQYKPVPKATASYGATVAVITPLKGTDKEYMVIVVGEIPAATARQVAVSVQPQ